MPGLRLTSAQARRLWHLDAPICETLLQRLLDEGFLRKTGDGAYMALTSPRQPDAPFPEYSTTASVATPRITEISEPGRLFTRGPHSIRLVRANHSTGCQLVVCGPGTLMATYEFPDLTECIKYRTGIEQKLLAQGYQLSELSSDRRSDQASRSGPDHRRLTDAAFALAVNARATGRPFLTADCQNPTDDSSGQSYT